MNDWFEWNGVRRTQYEMCIRDRGIANDYLVDFTRTMIDLGNSTDIVANDAASTLAKFANITTMDQSQFGNLGATLVDVYKRQALTADHDRYRR